DSIDDGAGPLVPFVLLQRGDERAIARFAGDDLGECVAAARKEAGRAAAAGALAAVAFAGYLTTGGERCDATFVEAAESADGPTVTVAQRDRIVSETSVEPRGTAAYIACGDGLFA